MTPILNLVHDRICGVMYQAPGGRCVRIYSVYLPSPGSCDDYESVLDDLAGQLSDNDNNSLAMICGDWNADMGHLGGKKSNRTPTKLGRIAAAFFNEFSLYASNMSSDTKGPLNTFKGGVGSSTIDYIVIPYGLKHLVISSEILEDNILNLSDHNAVRTVIKKEKDICKVEPPVYTRNIKWSKLDRDTIHTKYTSLVDECCNRLLRDNDLKNMPKEGLDALVDSLTSMLVANDKQLPRSRFAKHIRPF